MSKDNINEDHWDLLFKSTEKAEAELLATGSDRACVIVATAFLDDLLGALLKHHFLASPTKVDELFDNSGPLGTFNAKIGLAFRLGLLSCEEYKLLHTIRKIRNDFAHSSCTSSFGSTDSVKDLTNKLQISDQLWFDHKGSGWDSILSQIPALSPQRKTFVKCVIWLKYALFTRSVYAGYTRLDVIEPFKYAFDIPHFVYETRISWIEKQKKFLDQVIEKHKRALEKGNTLQAQMLQEAINRTQAIITKEKAALLQDKLTEQAMYEDMKREGLLNDVE